jgi:hypothetical protein
VLEAYRALDDPEHQQKEVEGSVVRKTRTIMQNIATRRKEFEYWEMRMYYQMAEQWYEEVEEALDIRQKKTLLGGLQKMVPKNDALTAERIYRLFNPNYGALRRLQGVTHGQIAYMSVRAFEELEKEVQEMQRGIIALEEFDFVV